MEAATRVQIRDKSEELRQLVGNRYRDLIDSADSIVLMRSSCESISANVSAIRSAIVDSLPSSSEAVASSATSLSPARSRMYGIACRVKYLVDTPENIWGCLDEFMLLEAASRYIRAKQVHQSLVEKGNDKGILSNFPLLQHQWQIVESFKLQISQKSRERLLSLDHNHTLDLSITAYADALSAVAIVDDLHPKQVLSLFLDSRKSCISQILCNCSTSKAPTSSNVINAFCEVLKIIQVTLGQTGELFLQVLNDMPLFYKVILGSPPASQLFGSIPDPDEEVRLWEMFRDNLESIMVMVDRDFVARTCSAWLKNCGKEVVNKINGRYLIDSIGSGQELASAEKLIRETMEGKQVLEGSLEWLKSVFGSEIELPWNRIRELVLGDEADLWDEIFEDAFGWRMKAIVDFGYNSLSRVVSVRESIDAIVEASGKRVDLGGVWFTDHSKKVGPLTGYRALPEENDLGSCLNAYFGAEVGGIRDAVDSCCRSVLEDLLSFLDSPKASIRLKELASYLQNKCYQSISSILVDLKNELEHLSSALDASIRGSDSTLSPAIIVERSLFIGRLMFAFQKHSKHIPIILGSPKRWLTDTKNGVYGNLGSLLRHSSIGIDSTISDSPRRNKPDSLKRQSSLAAAALMREDDNSSSPQLEELYNVTRDLTIRAHDLWISWVSYELSAVLSRDLGQDDGLSTSNPLRGWEDTVVKQEQSDDSQSEMKISLPSMPSLYITSFLFQACEEIHRIGGHVLDKRIPQKLALRLLEKVIKIYSDFLSTAEVQEFQMSDKGALQVLLDLRFTVDVLSGGDTHTIEQISKQSKAKFSFRRNQDVKETKSVVREQIDDLVNSFSKTLDPIDWLTYEPYLWENERQSYLRHAVLFGFFVQLNRMYTDTVQKLPVNAESNIMRCSTVPRFKYLPISAPALSSRGTNKTSVSTPIDDVSSRNSWKGLAIDKLPQNIDMDDESSLTVAAPFLKSVMQVGSRFGESTLKLGSMLTDGQVGRFKDKSAASVFGDMLPSQAAGLLSSFTASRSDP